MSYWRWTFLLARKQINVLDDDDKAPGGSMS